jgi:hypothetical protein
MRPISDGKTDRGELRVAREEAENERDLAATYGRG